MPRARIEAFKLNIDGVTTSQRTEAKAKEFFLEALSVFLKEVVKHVPVWSGMSRGSLRPLARFITDRGYKVSIPISPRPSSLRARQNGQNIEAGEERGDFQVTLKNGIYLLVFEPKVKHYKTNEFTNVTRAASEMAAPRKRLGLPRRSKKRTLNLIHPTPWQSFTYGNLKMRFFINSKLAKIQLDLRFKTTKISVGRSRGT